MDTQLQAGVSPIGSATRQPRRTSRRALQVSSLALPAAVALSACGGTAAAPDQPSTVPVTLSFLHHDWNPVELDSFKRDTEAFREAGNSNVTFTDQLIPYDT